MPKNQRVRNKSARPGVHGIVIALFLLLTGGVAVIATQTDLLWPLFEEEGVPFVAEEQQVEQITIAVAEDSRVPSVIENADGTRTHAVIVRADGSFSPQDLEIEVGDTVAWDFYDRRTDNIVSVSGHASSSDICTTYQAYDAEGDFTGPYPRAISGVFTIAPHEEGWKIEDKNDASTSCPMGDAINRVEDRFLCPTGVEAATMDYTWQNPNLTGVYIRLEWSDVYKGLNARGAHVYDWSILDREIEKAVKNGKVYSLSFRAGKHGTPPSIFEQGVEKIYFRDGGDDLNGCGSHLELGSPIDPDFQRLYFDLIERAAEHIKEKNAWYRALAYYKPSGANMFTHENRLPRRCEEGCFCNTEAWATQGDWTPEGIYDFFSKQTAVIAAAFPEKDMSYQLIQAGFPQVQDAQNYYPISKDVPSGVEQTEEIIKQGIEGHGARFAVQHNGIGPLPQDRSPAKPSCPFEGEHPVHGPYPSSGSGCPNQWALKAGVSGTVTGFQTNNPKAVHSPETLESSFQNIWENSDAIFLEIYEQVLWQVEEGGGILTALTGHTIADWAEKLHVRRMENWGDVIPDPFPETYRHTFVDASESELYYINAARCGNGARGNNFGVITVH
jgi:plastocyanin